MVVLSRPFRAHLSSTRRRGAGLRVERLEERTLLSFSPPVNYDLWLNPAGMASADLNGDGYPDLVAANANFLPGIGNGQVSIQMNNGDGTFGAPSFIEVGKTPASVVIDDYDFDGFLDFAVNNSNRGAGGTLGPGSVTLLWGDGTTWARRFDDIVVGSDTSSIAQGDLTGDGYTDLVVTNVDTRAGELGSVMMLVNNGDGTFAEPVVVLEGVGPDRLGPGWVVVGDYNADTILDLAVSCGRGASVRILLGIGDGTFAEPLDHVIHSAPYTLRSGDFNGDGIPDLIASHGRLLAQGDERVSVLLGNGDGTFQPFIRHDIGTNPLGVITGDFNGDGLSDIVVSNPPPDPFSLRNIIHVGLSNGDGTFTNLDPITTGSAPLGLVVEDFDLVNGLDLAVTNANPNFGKVPGSVSILLNDGMWPGPRPNPGSGSRKDPGAGLAFLSARGEDAILNPVLGARSELRLEGTVRLESVVTPSGESRRIDLVFAGQPEAQQQPALRAQLSEFELLITIE